MTVKKVLWEPSATKQNTAVTIHENGMKVWDVEKGASVASADGWGSKVLISSFLHHSPR
tara:strand:+ start:425 stop:601 length:177 start_codon:yes stop_codon:yes gene_type:complete